MPAIYLGQTFNTVEDFLTAMSLYEEEQHVPYVIGNSKSAKAYNSQQVDGNTRMPEEMRWKQVSFTCKHFGIPRHVNTPSNERTYNKPCCRASFNLTYSLDIKCLVVTRVHELHCH